MDLLDRVSDGVLLLTLWSTGIGIGMSLGLRELLAPLRQAGLVARVAILDVAGIPLIVWALVEMLSIPADYGAVLAGLFTPSG